MEVTFYGWTEDSDGHGGRDMSSVLCCLREVCGAQRIGVSPNGVPATHSGQVSREQLKHTHRSCVARMNVCECENMGEYPCL